MLRQATVEDVTNQRVTRVHGRIVVVTHYYPRYLKKKLIHDYFRVLAPTEELLGEFKSNERATGLHDEAFEGIDYESKFTLGKEGLERLRELAELSKTQTVYLVCHCRAGQRCHRELLLLAARQLFGASIPTLSHDYPVFEARLREGTLLRAD